MTEIVPFRIGEDIRVSDATRVLMRDALHPDCMLPRELPAARLEEARQALAAIEERCAPSTEKAWASFLAPLVLVCQNAPAEDVLAGVISTIALALSGVPGSMLTPRRQAEAVRRFHFWPTPAELNKWLMADAAQMFADRSALRKLAALRTAPEREKDSTPFDRTKADEAIAALKARDRGGVGGPRVTPARSSFVRSDVLRQHYEGAAARLAEMGDEKGLALVRARMETLLV